MLANRVAPTGELCRKMRLRTSKLKRIIQAGGDVVREIRSGVQRAASSAMGVPVMIRVDASREPLAGSGPRLGSIACPVATFVRARLAACCKVEPKSLHENAKLNTI